MSDIRDEARALTRANAQNAVHNKRRNITFAASAKASATVDPAGANNSLDYTAEVEGAAGNNITVQYKDPGALSQALSVDVSGSAIVVNLATNAGTNEVQTLTILASGGFFMLGFRDQTTGKLAYNISAADLQAALRALPTINGANVTVSGSAGGPYTITFVGTLAATDVPLLAADKNGLRPFKPHIEIIEYVKGTGSVDEIQKVRLQGATVGTFTLTYSGQTTSALAYNVSAADMLTALQALSNWNDSAGAVTKSGSEYTITFSGTGLTHTDVVMLTANASGLRPNASVVETTPGVAYAITTTASQVITAIRASNAADALVSVALHAANSGATAVTAMPAQAFTGGLDGAGSKSGNASYTTNLSGHTNNDLIFTAVPTGVAGNGISISYVDPGGVTAALGVVADVQERTIVVNLGRAASAINTTATALKAAIDADVAGAALLVTVANAGGNDGSGLVEAMSAQLLAGGGEGAMTLFTAHGDTLVAVNLPCGTDLTGASATLEVGKSGATTALIPTTTATTVDAGTTVDKTGVVSDPSAVDSTPFYPINDGESIILTPKTANITGGTVTAICYFKQLDAGAYFV